MRANVSQTARSSSTIRMRATNLNYGIREKVLRYRCRYPAGVRAVVRSGGRPNGLEAGCLPSLFDRFENNSNTIG